MESHPRLRRAVRITRRTVGDDETYFLVREPATGTFLRMGETEAAVLRLLDGTRSLPEVVEALAAARGARVGLPVLEGFVASMTRRGVVEARHLDPAAFRQEWLRSERARSRSLGSIFGSLTYFRVKLLNPERAMSAVARRIGFVFTPGFVAATLALMAAAALVALNHREAIGRDLYAYLQAGSSSAGSLALHGAILYAVLFFVVAVHESFHGLTCAHFGGRVRDVGVAVMYLQIVCFYCDVTDAYGFERRGRRVWTTLAGGYSGLVLASLGVFLWWASEPGELMNDAALMLMLIGGPPLLALNWNPFLRLDGYYILMDLLEAPNLMANSMKYLGLLFKTKVLRVPAEPMTVTPRLRRIYVLYGLGALLFIAPLVVYMPIIAYYLVSSILGEWIGLGVGALVAWKTWVGTSRKALAALRYAWLTHVPRLAAAGEAGRARLGMAAAGAAVALVLLALGPRVAGHSHGAGVLEPLERIDVRAAAPGFVPPRAGAEAWPALEGRRVEPDDLLVTLANPELRAEARVAALDLAALRVDVTRLQASGEAAEAGRRRAEERAAASRVATLAVQEASLALRSPIAGLVLTPRLPDRAGTWLRAGDLWCTIGRSDRLRLSVPLTPRDLGLIRPGARAEVSAQHFPGRAFPARVTRMPAGRRLPAPAVYPPGVLASSPGSGPAGAPAAPAAVSAELSAGGAPPVAGSLEVEVEVDNAEGLLRPGMTARVRIHGERLTLVGHAARWVHRLFKGRIWW